MQTGIGIYELPLQLIADQEPLLEVIRNERTELVRVDRLTSEQSPPSPSRK